jgi:hypothetical protein
MNKRQWQIVGTGCVSTALLMSLGTSRLHPPVAGPVMETSPGQFSASFTDAVMPLWVLIASLGVVTLTGASVYHSRKNAQ